MNSCLRLGRDLLWRGREISQKWTSGPFPHSLSTDASGTAACHELPGSARNELVVSSK